MVGSMAKNMQPQLVRAMLAALALAAGAGVLAIFLPGADLLLRICGTGVMTAVAIALAMRETLHMERQAASRATLLPLAGVVAGYICAVLGIWVTLVSTSVGWSLTLSAIVFVFSGSLLGAVVRQMALPVWAWAARFAAAVTCVATAEFLIGAWGPMYGSSEIAFKSATSGGIVLLAGITASACLVGLGVDRWHWRLIGYAGAVIAGVLALCSLWVEDTIGLRPMIECSIIAVCIAHANLTLRIVLAANRRWLIRAAVGASTLAGLCLSIINLSIGFEDFAMTGLGLFGQCAVAAMIVGGCSTMAALVVQRATGRRQLNPVAAEPSTYKTVLLECPRCQTLQRAPVGTSGCTGCGLLLHVRISTPVCQACNYSTLDLKSPTCPECGASLNQPGALLVE